MLLAYALRTPQSPRPELCIIPERPDQFSCLIPVDILHESSAAVYRIGQGEAFRVWADAQDGGIVIEPVQPSKIYLTPSQADRPGILVKSVKIVQDSNGCMVTFYKQDRGQGKESDWQRFHPNQMQM